jgi:undecaprenyl-phosphate 4-deoxy-4-formamido-L-arabinose transferase
MNIVISVVIPVYNSSEMLTSLCSRISASLNSLSHELILVNDGSTDESWLQIKKIASENTSVKGICLRKNFGQDNAIMAGLRIAKGEYVVIMDDDLQHAPEDILKLYEKCKEGFDVCFANFNNKNQSLVKNIGSDVNGRTAQMLVSKPSQIYLSPFKIILRSVVEDIVKYTGPFPYIDGIILTVTSNLTQIPLERQKREQGKTNYTLKKSFSVFSKTITNFSVMPLRIATITGFSAAVIGFLLALYYLYDYFIADNFIEGWTTIVILIIFFGGLVLMSLGIIGEYIGRIFLSQNNKPQYTISEMTYSETDHKS